MNEPAVQALLEVVAGFDELGGASPGLVAWELFADEPAVSAAWEHPSLKDGSHPLHTTRSKTSSCGD